MLHIEFVRRFIKGLDPEPARGVPRAVLILLALCLIGLAALLLSLFLSA